MAASVRRKAPGGNKAPKAPFKSGVRRGRGSKVAVPRPKGGAAGGRGY